MSKKNTTEIELHLSNFSGDFSLLKSAVLC